MIDIINGRVYVHDIECDLGDDCTCEPTGLGLVETHKAPSVTTLPPGSSDWYWDIARALRRAAYRTRQKRGVSVKSVALGDVALFFDLNSEQLRAWETAMAIEIRNNVSRVSADRWAALDHVYVRDFGLLLEWARVHCPARVPALEAADVEIRL